MKKIHVNEKFQCPLINNYSRESKRGAVNIRYFDISSYHVIILIN